MMGTPAMSRSLGSQAARAAEDTDPRVDQSAENPTTGRPQDLVLRIAQVSYCYRPIVGGQEVYIANLQQVLTSMGHSSSVYQPFKLTRGSDVVLVPRLPGIGRIVEGADEHVFRAMLRATRLTSLRKHDLVIIHYAFHAKYLSSIRHKAIVLSHGIEWNTENPTPRDRAREENARACFDHFPLVANDTDYLRHFGVQIASGTQMFTEVAPKKWFIPNCVDTDHFCRRDTANLLNGRQVIFVPRQITPDRGIDLAIRAFAALPRSLPEARLCIAGKTRDHAYLAYCKRLARELGVDRRVDFRPPIPWHLMPLYYCSAAITLVPSVRREGTSLSCLESMACGTPAVSTDVGGLSDLPALRTRPTAESLSRSIAEALVSGPALRASQEVTTRATFNLDNWSRAWKRVLESVSSSSRDYPAGPTSLRGDTRVRKRGHCPHD